MLPDPPDESPGGTRGVEPDAGPPPGEHARHFPARMEAFPAVRSFIEEMCRAATFGRDDCAKLVLLIEELFTNTVMHGHGGGSDASVRLACQIASGRIALAYEDAAPPHDPFASWRPPDERSTVEERPVGGLGVVLVAGMAERVEYSYAGGRNRISVLMTRSA
jgi:serine/threonine-protein kinase RsbW